jgi:mannosyltransferase OCH1-like enzyme
MIILFRYLILIVLLTIYSIGTVFADFREIDFDEATSLKASKLHYKAILSNPSVTEEINYLRNLYERNKPSKVAPLNYNIIPKIIHQIWIGEDAIPAQYKYYQQTWKEKHPDWEYRLWDNEAISKLDLGVYKNVYNNARTFVEKADILRYFILNEYGGIYADLDVESVENLDFLVNRYDFVTAIEAYNKIHNKIVLNNGFIGSKPNNEILTKILDFIVINDNKLNNLYDLELGPDDISFHDLAVRKTMLPLAEVFFTSKELHNRVLALPTRYTMPAFSYFDKEADNKYEILKFLNNEYHATSVLFDRVNDFNIVNHKADKTKSDIIEPPFKYSYSLDRKKFKKLLNLKFSSNKEKLLIHLSMFNHFHNHYYKNNLNSIDNQIENIIHKKIHFINLDNKVLTESQKNNLQRWKELHPGWEIVVWNMEKLKTEGIWDNDLLRRFSLESTKKLILSMLLVNQIGGVYASLDIMPLKNLKEFIYKYKFFTGIKRPNDSYPGIWINENIFGAISHSLILTKAIEDIKGSNFNNLYEDLYSQTLFNFTYNAYKFSELERSGIFPPTFLDAVDQQKRKQDFAFIRELKDKIYPWINWKFYQPSKESFTVENK